MSDEITVLKQEELPLVDMAAANSQKNVSNDEDEEELTYDGFEVARDEFFAHLFKPSVTFNNEQLSVNVACLRQLPNVEYVQFLVNPEKKKLAVRPCRENDKDAQKWATDGKSDKRKARHITCRIFYAKLFSLMGWRKDCRYQILGKLRRIENDQAFVFNLVDARAFMKKNADKDVNPREALYPEDWKDHFGVPVSEHQNTVDLSIFDEYTVFRLERDTEEGAANEHDDSNNTGFQEKEAENIQADVTDIGES